MASFSIFIKDLRKMYVKFGILLKILWKMEHLLLVMHMRLRCLLSITTPVSLLVNEFDVRSILHGQVRLAAVNQTSVVHEDMNGWKNLKIH